MPYLLSNKAAVSITWSMIISFGFLKLSRNRSRTNSYGLPNGMNGELLAGLAVDASSRIIITSLPACGSDGGEGVATVVTSHDAVICGGGASVLGALAAP